VKFNVILVSGVSSFIGVQLFHPPGHAFYQFWTHGGYFWITVPNVDECLNQCSFGGRMPLADAILDNFPQIFNGILIWGVSWPTKNINTTVFQKFGNRFCRVTWCPIMREGAVAIWEPSS